MKAPPSGTISLCVVMTCFNRRAKTLACLEALAANRQALNAMGVMVNAVLVDDGSTDGTADAVQQAYPWIQVLRTAGDLYWCRGMHLAQQQPRVKASDYQLWLNDDVLLNEGALHALLACEAQVRAAGACKDAVIIVGATQDAVTLRPSYGGEMQSPGWAKTRFIGMAPTGEPQRCDSMNGNIVLINKAAAARVGDLDPVFEHAMGDTDYALRARRLGVPVWLAPGFLGTCSDNPTQGGYRDASLPWRQRWRLMLHRKGLPWRSWLHFTRRHMGWNWPLYFAWPYAKLCAQAFWRRGND